MISSVVTTKNEEKVLGSLLESIKGQNYKEFEIVVIDNGSQDATRQIALRYTKKVFTKGPERSTQRNYGVAKSHGEYVLILDADMVLEKNVLKELAGVCSKNPDLGAAIVPEKSFGEGFWAKCKAFEREFYVGDTSIEAPRFFKRELFLEFGGYDTKITGPEDYDLPLRMKKSGVKIGRIKSFISHNEKKFSPLKSAKKKFYYASRSRSYLRKHPEMLLTQGNMLLRPVFFRKWKKLIGSPGLAIGMFFIKGLEMIGALAGIAYSGIIGEN